MGAIILLLLFVQTSAPQSAEQQVVIATVNGARITNGDLAFAARQFGTSDTELPSDNRKLIDRLVDRQLIREFLANRMIEPAPEELELQIAKAERAIKKRGEDPKTLLQQLGYTPDRLKSELGLTLAWQSYVRKTVTPEQLKEYFHSHKIELDGTQLRASQIFLKVTHPSDQTEVARQVARMSEIRQSVLDKKLTFSEAAKKFSESPSREQGGDIGLFGWRGKLPPSVSKAAFGLQLDEISEPIVSPFGVHLIQITERHPGDFSLEDVRSVILDRLSQKMWAETVQTRRETAKIEIHSERVQN